MKDVKVKIFQFRGDLAEDTEKRINEFMNKEVIKTEGLLQSTCFSEGFGQITIITIFYEDLSSRYHKAGII